jgi:uncharacterized protein (TIGR00369 family)
VLVTEWVDGIGFDDVTQLPDEERDRYAQIVYRFFYVTALELGIALGYLHGGANVVLAESVATVGAWLNCPPGKVAFGSEINASHLRPKRSGTLTAVGTPVQVSSKNQVWEVRIHDEDEKPVCVSRCRLAVVDAEE